MSDNQSTSESAVRIIPNSNPDVDYKDTKFTFRTIKDETTGVETKRPNIEVKLPVPSVEGIVKIITEHGGKQLDLLLQAAESIVSDFVKSLLADDSSITTENFPYAKVTWEEIANQPESERKGRGIPKEIWEDFIKSYIATMPALTGKTEQQTQKAAGILANKLNFLKNHQDKELLLPKFKDLLTIYLNGSPDAEKYQDCVSFLLAKADQLLKADNNADLAANLGF